MKESESLIAVSHGWAATVQSTELWDTEPEKVAQPSMASLRQTHDLEVLHALASDPEGQGTHRRRRPKCIRESRMALWKEEAGRERQTDRDREREAPAR